jgi:hypothetical protein
VLYRRAGRTEPRLFSVDGGTPVEARPPSRLRFDDLEALAEAAEAC